MTVEISVGRQPLRLDVLLLRKTDGELTDLAHTIFPELTELLTDYTYMEFKSPSDRYESGDYEKMLGVTYLHRSELARGVHIDRASVIFLVPRFNKAFKDDLKNNNTTFKEVSPKIYRIDDGAFKTWCVETSVADFPHHPGISLVSPSFQRETKGVVHALTHEGLGSIISYFNQLLGKFRTAEPPFSLTHAEYEEMVKLADEVVDSLLSTIPKDTVLGRYSVEDRLKGLPARNRFSGLSAHDAVDIVPARDLTEALFSGKHGGGLTFEEIGEVLGPDVLKRIRQDGSDA